MSEQFPFYFGQSRNELELNERRLETKAMKKSVNGAPFSQHTRGAATFGRDGKRVSEEMRGLVRKGPPQREQRRTSGPLGPRLARGRQRDGFMGSAPHIQTPSTPTPAPGCREDRNRGFNHCAAAVNQSAMNPSFMDFDATV